MRRILGIWLPSWPIQRLVVARPELSGRAIVLHAPDARRGRRVVYCSMAAAVCGVRIGMVLAEATALLEKGPSSPARSERTRAENPGDRPRPSPGDPYLEAYDALADREALERLAVWCERFSPLVGLEAADQPSGLLLDVTGLRKLLGNEEKLARDVRGAFFQRGYRVRVAIADTIGTAWAVARSRRGQGDISIVPPSENVNALRPLPVQALRLADQTVELLHQLGIFTVGQLAALPRASLSSRFGDLLLQRWDQATGAIPETMIAHRPPPPLEAQWTLEHPTARREVLDQVLVHLTEHLAQRLMQQSRGAIELLCQLDGDRGGSARIEVGLFRPTVAAPHLMELIRMQLDPLQLPGPVHHVSIQALTTAVLEDRQHQILDDGVRDVPRELARLVDRLSSRLGRDGVVRAQLQAEAQVEYAYRYVPLTGPRPRGRSAAASGKQATTKPGQRPLRFHVPPYPVHVIAVVPQGPPISFTDQGQSHRIAHHWGPERIETGWWRGRTVRRDYYRVENQHGSRFWLFRRLDDGKWFLQGAFE